MLRVKNVVEREGEPCARFCYSLIKKTSQGVGMLESFFKLKENGSDVRTEVIAGFTTFLTMAYIVDRKSVV